MKKLLSLLLVLCMLMSSVVIVSAEAGDFVKTLDNKEFTFTKGQAVTPGGIMFTPGFAEGETVNLNDYKYVDIAIYAYNADAIGGTLMQFEMTSSGSADVEENCYSANLSAYGLVNGWNVVRVPVEKWMSGPANVAAINFWRFFSATMYEATDDAFIKIYSATLTNSAAPAAAPAIDVTLPDFVPPEVKESVYVATYAEVVYDKTFEIGAGAINPGVQVNFNGEIDPLDITDVSYVALHIDVDKPEQFGKIEFQFELCSGGACDAYENNFTGYFTAELEEGKNVIKVPIDDFKNPVAGGFDKSKVNYIRMYSQAGTVEEAFNLTVEKVVFVNKNYKMEQREFTILKGSAVTPGSIMFLPMGMGEDGTVNLNEYKYVDLAIYAYNASAIGGTLMSYEMTSSGQPDVEEKAYDINLGDMGLVDGWNVIRIPTEKWMNGPAKVDAINFMRFFSATMCEASDNAYIMIHGALLTNSETKTAAPAIEVTLPDFTPPEEEVKEPVYVDATYEFEFDKTFNFGAGAVVPAQYFNLNKEFDPLNITDVAYVELHADISNAAQFMNITFEFELTSGGTCDAYENNRTAKFTGIVDGKNVIKVPIEEFSNVTGGGFDLSKINFFRMYSQGGNVAEDFTIVIDKVVFVNKDYKPEEPTTPETPTEKPEFGVVDSIMVYDFEDGAMGEVNTEIKTQGDVSAKFVYAADQKVAPGAIMWTKKLDNAIDVTGMTRFAFDVYVSNAAAFNAFDFCLELTSAGKADAEEYQILTKLGKLSATKELVDGWNTLYIDIEGAPNCDFTRFNFFRFFSNGNGTLGAEVTVYLDNFRFEKFVPEPVPTTDGVEVHQFTVFKADEEAYLLRTNAGNNGNQRFSDANFETVYKFTIKNRYSAKKITFVAPLGAQLLLQVSQDDANWTDLYVFEYDPNGEPNQGLPNKLMEFDLTDKVDLTKSADIYIRIADVTTDNGWGGSIFKSDPTTLTVEYTPMEPAELDAIEMAGDENSVALHGFNKAVGGMQKDTENYVAGSASNTFDVGQGKVCSINLEAPVDATGMDTLTFDLYVSDIALFDMFAGEGKNSGLEITSSGTWDKQELSWTLAAIRDNNLGGELKNGWNHIILPLETASMAQGGAEFNIAAINFIRFFMVNETANTGIVVNIDNMRLDNSGIARKEAQLKADQEVADKVIKLINEIGEVTLDSERAIEKAENAYKKLTGDQKALVTNKDVLNAAKDALKALQEAQNENPPVEGGDDQPPVEGGDDQPPVEGGDDQPPVDGGDDTPADESNNTVVIIIVVVAVVVIAAVVCVYFFVIKKKK